MFFQSYHAGVGPGATYHVRALVPTGMLVGLSWILPNRGSRLGTKSCNDAPVSLNCLKELLQNANETSDKVARSKKLAEEVTAQVLQPIEACVAKRSGPDTAALGGTSSTKPQYIAEYRFELPERERWIPQLRFALENEKKNDAELQIGVTVGQAWTDPKTDVHYPAHLRWGAFCLAADKAKRVQGPLRVLNRALNDTLDVMTPRPVTNKPTSVLSFVGKVMTVEDLETVESFEALTEQIADDLCQLVTAIVPEPVDETAQE